MQNIPIVEFVQGFSNYLQEEKRLSEGTVKQSSLLLKKIIDLHRECDIENYDNQLVKKYRASIVESYQNKLVSKNLYQSQTLIIDRLSDFYCTGTVSMSPRKELHLSTFYRTITEEILKYEKWSISKRKSVRSYSMPFFKWLKKEGCENFEGVDENLLKRYFLYCSARMKSTSLSSTKSYLLNLFCFLYDKELISDPLEKAFTFCVPIERVLLKPTSVEDIALVLNHIDRTTLTGKRNYAMILTAVVTGLRSVDILNLRLNDIDWRNGQIRIIQSKTQKTLVLPLTKDYGSAILEYIVCARPSSNSPFVFLKAQAPYDKLARGIIYAHYNIYRRELGLPCCSVHGLRRALGAAMVNNGVQINLVPEILGHSNVDSVRPYILLNKSRINECSLSFKGVEPLSGGFA